ncbi:PIN domain-containing protein [Streptomyces sp. W4I9-2]|uniref:PIN domain-containing protein n=1 Tax=Streptomyces sp. W4I9-2 TaxID=3042297 RepID=UPI0027D826DE|nr:PIN domain-containing protein [Streptomyces sp. W4I9-2]
MLVTPLPGTDRGNLITILGNLRHDADNLRGPFNGSAYNRLVRYLRWATTAARQLRYQVRSPDIDHLVLTRRYNTLLAGASSGMAGSHQEGLVNDLISLELEERVADFDTALEALKERVASWNQQGLFVVADTSVYIQHDVKLEEWDLRGILPVREEPIHLLVPMVVIDELDSLKQSRSTRWRAGYSLAVFERLLPSGIGSAILAEEDYAPLDSGGIPRGKVTIEILFDPPGHERLPINDDEIIDRAVAIQPLAGRPVHLLTYDTGQSMRGRAAGLRVVKLRDDAGAGEELAKT